MPGYGRFTASGREECWLGLVGCYGFWHQLVEMFSTCLPVFTELRAQNAARGHGGLPDGSWPLGSGRSAVRPRQKPECQAHASVRRPSLAGQGCGRGASEAQSSVSRGPGPKDQRSSVVRGIRGRLLMGAPGCLCPVVPLPPELGCLGCMRRRFSC